MYNRPRGGVALQWAMEKYVTKGDYPWLVVDDVYTKQVQVRREFCTSKDTMWAYKWAVFARKSIPKRRSKCIVYNAQKDDK